MWTFMASIRNKKFMLTLRLGNPIKIRIVLLIDPAHDCLLIEDYLWS